MVFFHFLHFNVPENEFYKQKWCMLFFTHQMEKNSFYNFKNYLWVLPTKITARMGNNNNFLLKITWNDMKQLLLNFLFHSKISDLHLVLEDFCKKRFLLKKYLKNHLKIFFIKLCRFLHTHRKGSSLLLQKLCKSNFHIYQQ